MVLDWLVFADPAVRDLVRAIESGEVRLATSAACTEELRRVLEYAIFKLSPAAQAEALARYAARASLFEDLSDGPAALPRCTDPDDQKFLDLAWYAQRRLPGDPGQGAALDEKQAGALGRFSVAPPGGGIRPVC